MKQGIVFFAAVLFTLGVWFTIRPLGLTESIDGTVVDTGCDDVSVGPSPGPSPNIGTCESIYTFNLNDIDYGGLADIKLDGKTVKISYKSYDPSNNRVGEPDVNYLGPSLLTVGLLLFVGGLMKNKKV